MEIRWSGSLNNEQHGCEIAPDRRPWLCEKGSGVPLLGHPCFWVEVIAILYTGMSYQSHPRTCVSVKIPQKVQFLALSWTVIAVSNVSVE
jgi:hypothetical protein